MPRDSEPSAQLLVFLSTPNSNAQAAKMAPQEEPLHKQAVRFTLDVINGKHALSKLIPLALWLADAVLCALIIWKVPCK